MFRMHIQFVTAWCSGLSLFTADTFQIRPRYTCSKWQGLNFANNKIQGFSWNTLPSIKMPSFKATLILVRNDFRRKFSQTILFYTVHREDAHKRIIHLKTLNIFCGFQICAVIFDHYIDFSSLIDEIKIGSCRKKRRLPEWTPLFFMIYNGYINIIWRKKRFYSICTLRSMISWSILLSNPPW